MTGIFSLPNLPMQGRFDDIARNLKEGDKVFYPGSKGVVCRVILGRGTHMLPKGIAVSCLVLERGAIVYQGNIDKWFLSAEEAQKVCGSNAGRVGDLGQPT